MKNVQLRSNDGELAFHFAFGEAWVVFLTEDKWWKISWTVEGADGEEKRVRIVKEHMDPLVLSGAYVEDLITLGEEWEQDEQEAEGPSQG